MITPTLGKIIIEKGPVEERHGSIILPDTAREHPNIGTVVAIRDENYWEDNFMRRPVARVGDRVLFGKYSGVEIIYEGRQLLVLSQREILAVLDPVAPEVTGAYA